jgi:hypothetical protein
MPPFASVSPSYFGSSLMRIRNLAAALLGAALVAVPVTAAIKAMTLAELMAITTDTVQVRITDKSSFALDYPFEGAVYTKLTVEGESLRTGTPVATSVIFLGSHDTADQYGTSEMPTLQDTRVGNEVVIFHAKDAEFPGGANVVHNLASVYRIEQVFGQPVLIGKGEGSAFPENVRLADARVQVKTTHQSLQAAPGPQDGK